MTHVRVVNQPLEGRQIDIEVEPHDIETISVTIWLDRMRLGANLHIDDIARIRDALSSAITKCREWQDEPPDESDTR